MGIEETVRLPIDFGDGPRNAVEMRQRLSELEAEARDLYDAFHRGGVGGERFREEMGRIGAESRRLTAQLDRVDDAATAAATGKGGRGGGMVGFGQAMMQAGRGVQDFQAAGLMGIVNNVEGLALALGAGAGVAGAATLAIVALQVFGPMLRGVEEEARGATDEIGKLEERIKALEGKPVKLTADLAELERLKATLDEIRTAKQQFDAEQKRQDTTEQAVGRAISDTIVETPGGQEAMDAAARAYGMQFAQGSPEVARQRQRLADARQAAATWEAEAEKARADFEAGRTGPTDRDERIRKAREAAQRSGELASSIEARLPEVVARQEAAGRSEFERQRLAATTGQGEAQRRAVDEVLKALTISGIAGGAVADQVRKAVGDARGKIEGEAAAGRAAPAVQDSANARRALEQDLDAIASADDFVVAMGRIDKAIRDLAVSEEDAAALLERAAGIRKRAQEAEVQGEARLRGQRAGEAEQEAERLAQVFAPLLADKIGRALAAGMPEAEATARAGFELQGRRGITDANRGDVARMLVDEAARRRAGEAPGADMAADAAKALVPQIAQAIARNEAAQATGRPALPDARMAAQLQAEAAGRLAKIPGVSPEAARNGGMDAVDAGMRHYHQQLLEMQAQFQQTNQGQIDALVATFQALTADVQRHRHRLGALPPVRPLALAPPPMGRP